METAIWRTDMERWLAGFAWQWFCTLTFRPGLSANQRRARLHHWLGGLRTALGTSGFGFFAIQENGRTGLDPHFHVLVSGLRESSTAARFDWMCRWSKMAGDCRISDFTPNAGGIRYILKNASADNPDAIEFDLSTNSQLQTTPDESAVGTQSLAKGRDE